MLRVTRYIINLVTTQDPWNIIILWNYRSQGRTRAWELSYSCGLIIYIFPLFFNESWLIRDWTPSTFKIPHIPSEWKSSVAQNHGDCGDGAYGPDTTEYMTGGEKFIQEWKENVQVYKWLGLCIHKIGICRFSQSIMVYKDYLKVSVFSKLSLWNK